MVLPFNMPGFSKYHSKNLTLDLSKWTLLDSKTEINFPCIAFFNSFHIHKIHRKMGDFQHTVGSSAYALYGPYFTFEIGFEMILQ